MKKSVKVWYLVCLLPFILLIQDVLCLTDSLTGNQVLTDGETIISAGGTFELGFFSPGMSTKRYLGIWYSKIPNQTVIWVANREVPLFSKAGFLEIIVPGVLVLRNETNGTIWSSNFSSAVQNPVARLLDSANLVVKDANDADPESFVWQSFDYPTDTFLPGMRIGRNFVTGHEVFTSSWKSNEDPAPGDYIFYCDPTGYQQNFIRSGTTVWYRTGPWNGQGFSGVPTLAANPIFSVEVVYNSDEVYYSQKLLGSTFSRYTLSSTGVGQRWTWDNQSTRWNQYLSAPDDHCDTYRLCGSFGSCATENSATCGCLKMFKPRNPENWTKGVWSDGCTRMTPLQCSDGDGFYLNPHYKLPDTRNSTFNRTMNIEECREACLNNCSCTAYSSLDIRNGGSGCLLWYDDLVDMKLIPGAGQDIYIKLASSDLAFLVGSHGRNVKVLVVILPLSLGMVLLGLGLLLLYINRWKKRHLRRKLELENKEIELPFFERSRIVKATGNFSSDKKLGEGGYGPVYLAKLEGGQEVAVKRLSEVSKQGVDEFKNEAICIAKLQHRNLVRLLGCCIGEKEKILIYEYMPNKSLDHFIFDEVRSKLLDWPTRFQIVQGIARGVLYLHQDSQLRIIHRDLKASNILLDAGLNPKISDFGMARSFGGNETGDNTTRVVGTHGYISPEYAEQGLFSVKSDVFSFGVLVMEIVSSKRNRMSLHEGHHLNLLGHAWRLNRQERAMELVDSNLISSCCPTEVLRAINVGLLCVQQCPEDRPDMSSVVLMLGSQEELPEAGQPGFFIDRKIGNADMTMTTLEAR